MASPQKGSAKEKDQSSNLTCNCLCVCFGLFDYDDWKFDYSDLPDLQEASVEILYRE